MNDAIQKNAHLVICVAEKELGVHVGFDRDGVKWLDDYITRQHEHGNPETFDGLVNVLGSYFGECILESYGGEWTQTESGLCIQFDEKNGVFPFSKVGKQLENGSEESVLGLFDSIPLVFKQLGD